MIYHKITEVLECFCGERIDCDRTHQCTLPSKDLKIEVCASCERCDKTKHWKWLESFWGEKDGYVVCSNCEFKCCVGNLPKQCGCYLDQRYSPQEGEPKRECTLCYNTCRVKCSECLEELKYGDECEFCGYYRYLWQDERCELCEDPCGWGNMCLNKCFESLVSLGKRLGWDKKKH